MALMIASGGCSAAALAGWTGRVGARRAGVAGGLLYGAGLGLCSAGVATHSLPLLYCGALVCGAGYGCAYTPPLQLLMDWFPDRRGLASGTVIAGFGAGALVFTPLLSQLTAQLARPPTFLGPAGSLHPVLVEGRQWVDVGGEGLQEAVTCTALELTRLPATLGTLQPGWYAVGSGSTGLAASLAVTAVLYSAAMVGSALLLARPPHGHSPAPADRAVPTTRPSVPVEAVTSTPQYWLLLASATLLATPGMALLSVASPLVVSIDNYFQPKVLKLISSIAGCVRARPAWHCDARVCLLVRDVAGRGQHGGAAGLGRHIGPARHS